jgi:hypothetical protein
MHPFLLTASLVLGAAAAASPQDSAPAAEPPQQQPWEDLGGPLRVGDVEIPELEIKRYLIYGPCRAAMEFHRVNAIIEDEIARRTASYEDELATWEAISATGADAGPKPVQLPADFFEVPEEALVAVRERKQKEFQVKYPFLDLDTEIRRSYRSVEWYERELRQEMRFDRTFVQDDPSLWPALTYEAMRQEAGEILIDDFRESYERRKAHLEAELATWQAAKDAGQEVGPRPEMAPEDSMYRSILRQIVRDAVYGVVDTKTGLDGLDPSLLVSMDFDWDGEAELSLSVDEIWEDVKTTVSQKEIDDARQFLALIEATRQRLEAEGKMLSDEEAAQHIEEVRKSFGSDIFGIGTVALGAHQFPSVEAYGAYMPLLEAYKRASQPQLAAPPEGGLPQALRDHLDFANQVMGLAKCDAEILLVSAFDFDGFAWIPGGWEKAREKAEWLKSEIEKNSVEYAAFRQAKMEAAAEGKEFTADEEVMEPHAFWSRLLDEHCDFWDPPPPAVGRPGSDHAYRKKGRFGERSRNDMRSLLTESPYSNFINGGLLTDEVFFNLPVGSIAGPLPGPDGWYLAKVIKRAPTQRPLNINDEKHLELLREDWVRISFIDYAHEALGMAEVVGLHLDEHRAISPR